ncbi:MAG: pentapeptide repeat-containing protein [Endozoicomonas sp. (ex Botrylloides leachii)]|nr:pentapeptide repeat-containing protein [Endozoicomonas sp. (ex Botrylloides leachii)]
MPKESRSCNYTGHYGPCKDRVIEGSCYCFWHDPEVDKSGSEVREQLELRAKTGIPMEGFILKKANLKQLNLVSEKHTSCHLINADLSRSDLSHAHFYKVNLSGSCLLKSNLSDANLHRANLSGCNLLGVNLKSSRLERVNWGKNIYQADIVKRIDGVNEKYKVAALYEEAEEVARNIRKQCENQGLFHTAGHFFHQEMLFRRYQMPLLSSQRIISKGIDLAIGYGEKPIRIVLFSTLLVLLCSFFYFIAGLTDNGSVVIFDHTQSFAQNLNTWLDCLYFSMVTFTTLGYGDLTPHGLSRLCAALEAFTGSFSLALFVVVVVKKMTR